MKKVINRVRRHMSRTHSIDMGGVCMFYERQGKLVPMNRAK